MVFVNEGYVLNWTEISKNLERIKAKSIQELLAVYNRFKDIENDQFKWGDEVELTLLKFDHEKKECTLLLKSEEFFQYYVNKKADFLKNQSDDGELNECDFHNEYTSYMIETIPGIYLKYCSLFK